MPTLLISLEWGSFPRRIPGLALVHDPAAAARSDPPPSCGESFMPKEGRFPFFGQVRHGFPLMAWLSRLDHKTSVLQLLDLLGNSSFRDL